MNYTIKQSDEQRLTVYLKLTKKELAKMLIQANKIIEININTDMRIFKKL